MGIVFALGGGLRQVNSVTKPPGNAWGIALFFLFLFFFLTLGNLNYKDLLVINGYFMTIKE